MTAQQQSGNGIKLWIATCLVAVLSGTLFTVGGFQITRLFSDVDESKKTIDVNGNRITKLEANYANIQDTLADIRDGLKEDRRLLQRFNERAEDKHKDKNE